MEEDEDNGNEGEISDIRTRQFFKKFDPLTSLPMRSFLVVYVAWNCDK